MNKQNFTWRDNQFLYKKKNNRWRLARTSSSFIICHLNLVDSQKKGINFFLKFFSGNGGDAGRINFRARHINGEVRLSVCKGHGAEAALNGRGGPGKLAGTFGNKDLKKSRF